MFCRAAWGWFALALRGVAEEAPPQDAAAAAESEQAARRALALDPREPNALTGLVLLRRNLDDLPTTEARLREILVIAPDNIGLSDYWRRRNVRPDDV
jgi:hypothetical protein